MTDQKARGTRAENAVADELGKGGYDIIRSAGSKGAADLVAVHDGVVLFVQVKLGTDDNRFKMPGPAERRELVRIAERATGFAVAACRFPGRGSRPASSEYRMLDGPGPKEWESWKPSGRSEG